MVYMETPWHRFTTSPYANVLDSPAIQNFTKSKAEMKSLSPNSALELLFSFVGGTTGVSCTAEGVPSTY
eukprot:1194375-Prorocentrum_minimum.AAC.4